MKYEVESYLQKSNWFSELPCNCQQAFYKVARLKRYVNQEVIHTKNELANGLFYVCNGKIRVSNFTPDGKEVVLTWLGADSWFGEISLFDELPRTHQATADEESLLINIGHYDFQHIIKDYPELYQYFIPIFCRRIRLLFELIEEARTLPIKFQLIKRLLHLSESESSQPAQQSICLDVSQESLALMLNTTRQSVNRWLNELQSEGLINLAYNKIDVPDLNKLQDFCQKSLE